jgi:hypothetical protein
MKLTPMKAFLGLLATAVGAAALLVACGTCDGAPVATESSRLSAADIEGDCTFCIRFDLDATLDDD